MNYDAAVRYLLSLGRELAAPTQAAAAKFNLENIRILSERLDHPERVYSSAHIAGTNGKGSTAAFLESVLRHAGFRTGLNTSPHLERINERIRVNGEEISDNEFAAVTTHINELIEKLLSESRLLAHPTYFECVTAMAFAFFAAERVQFGVFEVGLGGRLDATNILDPVVTILTRIDFDHENFLGHALREIAAEKAGILKPGVPVIIAAEQRPESLTVILERAQALQCPVIDTAGAYRVDRMTMEAGCVRATVTEVASGWRTEVAPRLPGRFQLLNALNAIAAARLLAKSGLRIPDGALVTGISNARWPGRIEKLRASPDVYLDGAHNPSAASELAAFLRQNFTGTIRLVFGAMRDKAVDEIAGVLFPGVTEVIFTESRNPRAISAPQLAEICGHHARRFRIIASAKDALEYALAESHPADAIFVAGSLYLAGELRHYWKSRVPTPNND